MPNIYVAIEILEDFKKKSAGAWFSHKRLTPHQSRIIDDLLNKLDHYRIRATPHILLTIDEILSKELYSQPDITEVLVNPKNVSSKNKSIAVLIQSEDKWILQFYKDEKPTSTTTLKLTQEEESLLKKYQQKNVIQLNKKTHISLLICFILNRQRLKSLKTLYDRKLISTATEDYQQILFKVYRIIASLAAKVELRRDLKYKGHLQQKLLRPALQTSKLMLPIMVPMDYREIEGHCIGYTSVFLQKLLYGKKPFGISPCEDSPFATISTQMELNHLAPLNKEIATMQSDSGQIFFDKKQPLKPLDSHCQ